MADDALFNEFEILAIGEQLRYRMHLAPNIIKERRYHLRVFPCCFIANETLDWLVAENEAPSRQAAIFLMNVLVQHHVIHHVCDDHVFKDQYLFFRFRQDDSTFSYSQVTRLFFFAQRIHDRLHSEPQSCLKSLSRDGVTYSDSFTGADFAQWMVRKNEAPHIEAALASAQQHLDACLIKNVSGTSTVKFRNSEAIYQFAFDFNYRRRLHDLFRIPSVQREAALQNLKYIPKSTSVYPGMNGNKLLTSSGKSSSDVTNLGVFINSPLIADQFRSALSLGNTTSFGTVLSDADFERKTILVEADSVGYGFVLRGSSPCYVQTVDPEGPASASGVKVGMYLYSVNDIPCGDKSHKDVADIIVKSGGKIRLVVAYNKAQTTATNGKSGVSVSPTPAKSPSSP